ncbi:hypothetical protein EON65_13030 [archaeon]|nr:MAG: hypothetical protein EON65_13030 [archaeon]
MGWCYNVRCGGTKPLIVFLSSLLDGYNACIMAYGQTGSGKTYTMVSFLTSLSLFYSIHFFFNPPIGRSR